MNFEDFQDTEEDGGGIDIDDIIAHIDFTKINSSGSPEMPNGFRTFLEMQFLEGEFYYCPDYFWNNGFLGKNLIIESSETDSAYCEDEYIGLASLAYFSEDDAQEDYYESRFEFKQAEGSAWNQDISIGW
ncbi:MAG: hypothetical protein SFT91_04530 [Rickettsiaceae bacterium]|nr:hypothetical protein [Rickettsiaceae bacterium]